METKSAPSLPVVAACAALALPAVAQAPASAPALAPAPATSAAVASAQKQDPAPAQSPNPAAPQQEPPPPPPQGVGSQGGPPRIVVTASGFAEEELSTPYTYQTMSQKTFLERGHRTLPEALRDIPGVMVQKTTHGHGSPYIRGFTGRQNLVLIDGIRFNNSGFRSGPVQYFNTIDAYSVDEIEVIKSQGSVLYGSDAAGGTVNLHTRNSNFRSERDGEGFAHGSALYRYDTNGGSHTGRIESQFGKGGDYGLHAGVTYRDFGNIWDRDLGTMEKTGYDEFDFDLRADVALDHNHTFTAAHQQLEQDDVWRTHNTIYFEPWQGTSLPQPRDFARIYDQDRSLSYARLAGEDLGGAIDSYKLTFSFQRMQEGFNRTRPVVVSGQPRTRVQLDDTDIDTLGAALSFESKVDEATITYGADWYRDAIDSDTVNTDYDSLGVITSPTTAAIQGPLGDDARYNLFGVFAQGRAPVSDDVELTLGGRYTYASADIGRLSDGGAPPAAISAEKEWEDATFNARVNVRVADEWSVYGGASQAFRAPNMDDLSALKSSRTGVISTGSLDVEPEHFLTYEVGTRHVGKEVGMQAAVFYTDITDLITTRPIGTDPGTGDVITTQTNGANGWLAGGEFETSWQLDRDWRASGFIAYVDGESDVYPTGSLTSVTEPISRLMPLTGSLALRWTHEQGRFWVEGRTIAANHEDRLNTADRADTSRFPPGGTPGYCVLMLSSGYKATDNLDLFVTLENVTDTSYRIHGSGVNQSGFNAIVGGKVSF